MNNINVIDIETYGYDVLTPYCVVIRYNNTYYSCVGLECLQNIIKLIFLRCESDTVFYAHNLTFDGVMLLNFLPKDVILDDRNTLLRKNSIYSLCFSYNNKYIFFKCSAKLLPLSLKRIAEELNLPLKLDFDHKNVDIDSIKDPLFKKKAIEYCKRDVEITFFFLRKFDYCVRFFLPHWKLSIYTISGLSLKIFLRLFNDDKINLNLSTKLDIMVRSAYYGGRCEVFGNAYDNEYVYHYDFSGMYSNRLKEKYPLDIPVYNDFLTDIDKPGFYYVSVESINFELPILPYRSVDSGKLTFPNGLFSGLYWHEELQLFIENGGVIKKIHWGLLFYSEGYPFKKFAEHCIKERKNGKIENILWKLIPNSFVGRLGLKYDAEETLIIKDDIYDPRNYTVLSDRLIQNTWLVRIKTKEKLNLNTNGNVCYAAITTSKARVLWWKTANNVQKDGGRVLYCDTDSLFVAFKKNINLNDITYIDWDLNDPNTYVKESCFFSSKFYYTVNKENFKILRLKGVPQKKIRDLDFKEIKKNFYNNTGSIKFKFLFFNKKLFNIKIDEIEKKISFNNYDKRVFSIDKKKTTPLFIKNESTLYNNE